MITTDDLRQIDDKSSTDRYLVDVYDGDIGALLSDLDKGLNKLIRSDLKAAEAFVRQSRALVRALPSKYRYKLPAMRARVAHFSGRYVDARRLYRQALKACLETRNSETAAKIRRALTEVYMYLGQYRLGLDAGRRSLRYFQRKGRPRDAAQVMTNMGNVYHRLDNNRMALRYYDRARSIFAEAGGVPLAIVDYNRANIMANMNRLDQARDLYLSAADVYAEEGMRIPETLARYSVAYLHFLEDRYADAMRVLETVQRTFQELGDIRAAAVAQLDLMEIDLQLNQYGSAVMIGEEIIPQFKKLGMRYEQAKAQYFSGRAKMALKDFDQAREDIRKAERLFTQETNYLWIGMTAVAYSELCQAQGKYVAAVDASQKARHFFVKSKDERRRIDADIASLEARLKAGGKGGLLRRAEELLKDNLARYQEYHVNTVLGEFYYSDENYEKALFYYSHAVHLVEEMLTGLQQDEIRFFFTVNKFESYDRLVECLLKLGRIEEAFRRNLSALALLNQPTVSEARLAREVPDSLMETMRSLRLSLNRIHAYPREGVRRAAGNNEYATLEQRLWRQERRLRQYRQVGSDTREMHRLADTSLSHRYVQPDEVLINFVVAEGRIGVFVARRHECSFQSLRIKADDLRILNRKLHFVCENTVSGVRGLDQAQLSADFYLRQLYDCLIGPIADRLEGCRLIILADGDIAQVPFAALRNRRGQSLINRFDLRQIVNPLDLSRDRVRTCDFQLRTNAVFAVPNVSLPAVADEGTAVSGLFSSGLFLGELATGDRLRQSLQEADGFVHLAAHASRSSENPLFSRILMGDGPFFPFDLYGSGTKARLITLSGCQTAAPGLNYGNSFSLAKAFQKAGGQYVLASLWPVADRLTKTFMMDFYTALRETSSVPQAYRRAVHLSYDRTNLAALWSAFVLLGL